MSASTTRILRVPTGTRFASGDDDFRDARPTDRDDSLELRLRRQEQEIARLRRANSSLETQLEAARETASACTSQIEVFRELEAALRERCHRQNCELHRLRMELHTATALTEGATRKKISELEAQRSLLTRERDSLQKLVNDKQAQQTAQSQALALREERLQRHERRLRNYTETLHREKGQVREASSRLASEIHVARSIHPLRDYLSLTEFELSRIELQLKKTPTSSPERSKFEATLTSMLEQRDFLRGVIEASEHELRQQAEALTSVADGETLAGPRPLPPKRI